MSAVVRKLLLKSEGLKEGERVDVVYPGPARHRYPAVLRERAGIGPAWLIEWEDGDTLHTKASPYSIYRRGGGGSGGGVYPAATPERGFAGELLEQRYLGLMAGVDDESNGGGMLSGEWAGSEEGMVHPLDPVLEEATAPEKALTRWPGLAEEVQNGNYTRNLQLLVTSRPVLTDCWRLQRSRSSRQSMTGERCGCIWQTGWITSSGQVRSKAHFEPCHNKKASRGACLFFNVILGEP